MVTETTPLVPQGDGHNSTASRSRIAWTFADIFANPPALAVFYHSVCSGYDVFTPIGAIMGGLAQPILFRTTPWLQVTANGGLALGVSGMALGAAGFLYKVHMGEQAKPVAWNYEGIKDRQERLHRNFMVRAMDLGTCSGFLAGGCVAAAQSPSSLGLSAGILGVLQALSLGATVGSLVSILYIGKVQSANVSSNDE